MVNDETARPIALGSWAAKYSLPLITGFFLFIAGSFYDTPGNAQGTRPGIVTIMIPDRLPDETAMNSESESSKKEYSAYKKLLEKEKQGIASASASLGENAKDDPGSKQTAKAEDTGKTAGREIDADHAKDKSHATEIKEKAKTIPVDIFTPKGKEIQGDVLVLPGWRFSRKRWQNETEILKLAEEFRFRTIFPEMGITNYESQYFPETTTKWAASPGGKWIKEIMIPELQKHGLLLPGKNNFILGLSTGGRGVLLVSLQNPGLFSAGATLSGDCNQAKMPHDRLMTWQYGPYRNFNKRWQTTDNPEISIMEGDWEMPLYIGHGKGDRISPFSQSESLYETIKRHHPRVRTAFNAPERAGHDFQYWNSEVLPVFKFFLNKEK